MFFQNGLCSSLALSPGNLDKVADAIAESVLDACLALDPTAIIQISAKITGKRSRVDGEFLTRDRNIQERLDPSQVMRILREVLLQAGYEREGSGIVSRELQFGFFLDQRHLTIAHRQRAHGLRSLGQVQVYGYATSETEDLIPAPLHYAQMLMNHYHELMRETPWLMPDARARVGFRYEEGVPVEVEAVSLECQHSREASGRQVYEFIADALINQVIPAELRAKNLRLDINPTGPYVINGTRKGMGVSGRQCVNDTYGGAVPFGGVSLAGKGPFSAERSATYMARHLACQVVARGWARRCLIRMEYAAGTVDPFEFQVMTEDSSPGRNLEIAAALRREFDLNLLSIIGKLDLARPVYRHLSSFGHFGRNPRRFLWEYVKPDVPESAPELFTHSRPEIRQVQPSKVPPNGALPNPTNQLYPYLLVELEEGLGRKEIAIEKGEPNVTILPNARVSHPTPYRSDGLISEECRKLLFDGALEAAKESGHPFILVTMETDRTRFLPDGEIQRDYVGDREESEKGEERREQRTRRLARRKTGSDLH